MRGGVLTRTRTDSLDAHVKQLIQESTLELFSHGTKGIVYKVHYHGADSGFLDVLTGRPATTFIMKIIPIDMLILFKRGYVDRSDNLRYVKEEVYAQSKVYKDSLDHHGCAPCPAVLHDFVYTVKELEFMNASYAYGFDTVVEVPTQDQDLRAGVIFMECLSSSMTLTKMNRTPNLSQRRDAIRLLFMALECGIDHGDPVTDNFLVDDKGQLTLIDFGSAKQLTPEETSRLKRMDMVELQREFTKRYKLHTWLLEEPFEMGPYPPRLPDKTVEQCREGLCYLNIDESLLTNEEARYHELYERQERIKEQHRQREREERERERERERVKREREREEREEKEEIEREQKKRPAIQRKIAELLQTYYTPKIPVENLPHATLEELKTEIIRLKTYIPAMNMLQLFNEGDERSIYISYLTKIAEHKRKGGTRKRRNRKFSRHKL
jgi:RIO-like serine/threonine protein kinase